MNVKVASAPLYIAWSQILLSDGWTHPFGRLEMKVEKKGRRRDAAGVCVAFDPPIVWNNNIFLKGWSFPHAALNQSSRSTHCESPKTLKGLENYTSVILWKRWKSRIVPISFHVFKRSVTSDSKPTALIVLQVRETVTTCEMWIVEENFSRTVRKAEGRAGK